jgi:hypothetical protein
MIGKRAAASEELAERPPAVVGPGPEHCRRRGVAVRHCLGLLRGRGVIGERVDVIVDRRHQERRRASGASAVDCRYGDRRDPSPDEQLRERGWAVVGDDVSRRRRVEWIVEWATRSRRSQ